MLFWIHISTSARKIQVSEKNAPDTRSGALRGRERSVDYSFTPPTAMPAMMYLLKAKYTMISGSAVMVRPR